MYFRRVNYMSIKPGERERRPASRRKQGLEGQGSLGSGKEGGLGEKLGEDAVCSISCSRLVQGVRPGRSLEFVSPGSLVTWSTLVGDPACGWTGPSGSGDRKRSASSFGTWTSLPWMEISPPQEAVNPQPGSFGGLPPLTLGGGWGGMTVGKCLSCSS